MCGAGAVVILNFHQHFDERDMNNLQVTIAAALAMSVPMAQAQSNTARVSPVIAPAVLGMCGDEVGSFCQFIGNAGSVQFAPDKLVMLGNAALVSAQQNVNIVQQHQAELRMTGQAGMAPSTSVSGGVGTASAGSTGTVPLLPGFGIFLRVEGDRDRADPTSFDLGFGQHATQVTVGADYRLTPTFVLGAALGRRHVRSAIDTSDGVTTGGSINARSNGLTLYGSWFPTVNLYADAIVQAGRGRHSTRRDIPILTDVALGDTSSRERSASLLLGYAFAQERWSYGPYARVRYSRIELDAYTEQANRSSSNLAVAAQRFTSLVTSLGAQVSYALSQPWGVLVPNARIELNHQSRQDKTRSILASFAQADDPVPIDIATTPVDRNYFSLDLGLAVHFGAGRSGVINYSTAGGRSGRSTHALTAELRLEF
jgi:outer membrane autotransporter protein